MSKKSKQSQNAAEHPQYALPQSGTNWQPILTAVAQRYNREYERDSFDLPAEVESLDLFRDWTAGRLQAQIASPFWELVCPKKNQLWLDIGCGLSFLVYPWRDWNAYFYGQEISTVARDALMSRGPQLNSKLFRGVELAPAHQLQYEPQQFDGAIATGWSCYFPLEYWEQVFAGCKRILKPGSSLIFDVVNPEQDIAEDWAILETYLGAEVLLTTKADWKAAVKKAGGTWAKEKAGPLFDMVQVRF